MPEVIRFTEKQCEVLDKHVAYIKSEYLNAGGSPESMMDDDTIWYALAGILHREGEAGLEKFIQNWKPAVSRRTYIRGYE